MDLGVNDGGILAMAITHAAAFNHALDPALLMTRV
jgi:hypothetical protein